MRIEDIEWSEGNEAHATRHGVSVAEIHQVFNNGPVFQKNKKERSADFVAVGITDGGRRVRVNFVFSMEGKTARPLSAWEV